MIIHNPTQVLSSISSCLWVATSLNGITMAEMQRIGYSQNIPVEHHPRKIRAFHIGNNRWMIVIIS